MEDQRPGLIEHGDDRDLPVTERGNVLGREFCAAGTVDAHRIDVRPSLVIDQDERLAPQDGARDVGGALEDQAVDQRLAESVSGAATMLRLTPASAQTSAMPVSRSRP